jgi:hypothetical protein
MGAENGILGKFPAPSPPVGEFTENPTFLAKMDPHYLASASGFDLALLQESL